MGQLITWVAPYQFTQQLPFDVDFNIMSTFLEFYIALLNFANFKLYSDFKMQYPPPAEAYDDLYLNNDYVHKTQEHCGRMLEKEEYGISEEFKDAPELRELKKKEEAKKMQRELFSKCRFFLSRETPIYSLQYLLLSFGGSFTLELDKAVTHAVYDRPLKETSKKLEYVQPQWVADSLNNQLLLPTQKYFPGIVRVTFFTDSHHRLTSLRL